ncbi:hypothetical protein B566_EDAN005113 [Ephemera danica]|nr:hypothetical protein B566_EDAN005113 [Ephemera danica]
MAEAQMLQELEMASQIMMAPPNVVTKEQRQSAEQVLLNFRTTKTPYNLCRHILESTSVDYVLFQVACTLREALIREWSFLQESDIISLRQYLFQFILNRTNIAPFVRERLLQASVISSVQILVKIVTVKGSVNDFGQERTRIVSEVENLIVSGDAVRQHLGCSIIAAIMQEYATTMKSCDVGLTWDTHFKVKKQFEATDLKRIFQFCVRALGELVRVEEANAQTRLIGMFETVYEADNSPPLRLGQMWKDVILDEAVISLFFQVHWKVRENQDLSHYSLVCLGQLATLSGTVVSDKDVQAQYITTYLTNFINFITNVEVLPWEALGIAQYLRKMLQHFSCSMLVTINGGELFTQFVQQLTRLTSRFAEGAAQEESVCVEDRRYMEAFDHLLEAWVSVLQGAHLYPADFCKQPSIDIFNTYLRCHLAPPDGTRGQGKPGDDSGDQDDQEIYETDEPDRIRFREQLIIIGLIGRQVLGHTLQVIARLLEERTERLRNQLQKAAAQNYSISDSSTTLSLFEDLHWLLLIAGHLVALESEGETALISDDIMRHSIQQGASVDVDASLRLLTTPGLTPGQLGVPLTSIDDTVRLVFWET